MHKKHFATAAFLTLLLLLLVPDSATAVDLNYTTGNATHHVSGPSNLENVTGEQLAAWHRNGWHSYVEAVRYTPDDRYIAALTKAVTFNKNEKDGKIKAVNSFVENSIEYIPDYDKHPERVDHGVANYVQYPVKTLVDGSGDCEDKAVLKAAMLESLGLKTGIIGVKGPYWYGSQRYIGTTHVEAGYWDNESKTWVVLDNSNETFEYGYGISPVHSQTAGYNGPAYHIR